MSYATNYEFESSVERIPSRTLLHGTDSTEKRVNMDRWVHQRLAEWSNERNRRMTQGVVAYECLLFSYDEMEDEIDRMEHRLNKQLSHRGVNVQTLDGLRRGEREKVRNEMEDIPNPYKTQERIRIWLPERIQQQASWERNWGERIGEAIVDVYSSVYSDRYDRLRAKRELVRHLDSDVEPDHSVARAVVGLDEVQYDIPDHLQAGVQEDEYDVESPDEYRAIAGNLSRWRERHKAMRSLYNNVASIGLNALAGLAVDSHQKIRKHGYARRKIRRMEEKFEEVKFGSSANNGGQETLAERMDDSEKINVSIGTMYQYADRVESREDKLDLIGLAVSNSEEKRIHVDDIVFGLRKCELEADKGDIADVPVVFHVDTEGVIHTK